MEELISALENKINELQNLEYSKSNEQVAIDICLDIKNLSDKLPIKGSFEIRHYKRNWKLSFDNFQHLLMEDEEYADTEKYWDDSIKEMVFDVEGLVRYLKRL